MNVVVDTNVVVSGIFYSGAPYRILTAWQEQKITICLSHEILTEYARVLEALNPRYPEIEAQKILTLLIKHSRMCQPAKLSADVCQDPDDIKFLACAVAGAAQIIISGDDHLLRENGRLGLQILKPAEFTRKYPHLFA